MCATLPVAVATVQPSLPMESSTPGARVSMGSWDMGTLPISANLSRYSVPSSFSHCSNRASSFGNQNVFREMINFEIQVVLLELVMPMGH